MPTWRATVQIASPVLGGIGTNTFHMRTGGEIESDEDSISDLMAAVQDFYDAMHFYSPTGTVFSFDGLSSGVGDDEGQYVNTDPWSVTGAASGGSLPPANAIVINWRGSTGDRSRRGRTFFGPCAPVTMDSDGTVADTQLAEIRTFAANLVSESDGFANGALGVYSRQENVFRDWVASSVRDQFGVLRSRRD